MVIINFNIIKILQKDGIWKDVNNNDYELKMLELKKGHPKLQLVYNNEITIKIIYICNNCKIEKETSWRKFLIQQYYKNKCLCHICSIKTKENRKKISEKTKEAMNTEKVKNNHSKAQKKRWSNENERKKRSLISKEIIMRPGMKEYISKRTKEEMNKLDTKQLCNPYKNMNDNQKKDYIQRVSKSISANYNKLTYEKYKNTFNNTMKNIKN